MRRMFAFCVFVIGLAGCNSGPVLTEVEGVVTMQGKPMSQIEVEFWPEVSGPRSMAITDEQGKFVLKTDDTKRNGAVPGKHKVVLRDHTVLGSKRLGKKANSVDMTEGRKSRISEVYLSALRTPLSIDVTQEKKTIDLVAQPNTATPLRQVSR